MKQLVYGRTTLGRMRRAARRAPYEDMRERSWSYYI